jgi:hypothetical protein
MNGIWRSPVLKPKSATWSGQRITTNTPNIISDRCAGTKNGRKRRCRNGRLPTGRLFQRELLMQVADAGDSFAGRFDFVFNIR